MFILFNDTMSVVPDGLQQLFGQFLSQDDEIDTVEDVDVDIDRLRGRMRTIVDIAERAVTVTTPTDGQLSWLSIPKLCGKSRHRCALDGRLREEIADVYTRLVEHEKCVSYMYIARNTYDID